MNKTRISQSIESALNAQLTNEAHAAQIYLGYGAWLEYNGYTGIADMLFRHANEERNHMMKILSYILKRGGKVSLSAIPKPHENPSGVNDCFEKILSHETANTNEIYKIVKLSLEEEDWATWNFMQWFVKEQVEEESFAQNLLNKTKIAGGDHISSNTLYELDRDIVKFASEIKPAEQADTENP